MARGRQAGGAPGTSYRCFRLNESKDTEKRKETIMSSKDQRVLSRMGAHELTLGQTEQVSGSFTMFTKIITGATPPLDLNNDI
jgi:hypothetical protein